MLENRGEMEWHSMKKVELEVRTERKFCGNLK
jgi:hypothetical protein